MKRTKEVRNAVNQSSSLMNRCRKLSAFRHWKKVDFLTNQARHEGVPRPTDQIEAYEMLKRFCERSGIYIPAAKKKAKVRTDYDGTNGFTKWRQVRYQALKRSNGRCDCCGATAKSSGAPLHVDHIKPKSLHPELAVELSNLQVLCADCNVGKGNWDETDWTKVTDENEATDQLDRQLMRSYPETLN